MVSRSRSLSIRWLSCYHTSQRCGIVLPLLHVVRHATMLSETLATSCCVICCCSVYTYMVHVAGYSGPDVARRRDVRGCGSVYSLNGRSMPKFVRTMQSHSILVSLGVAGTCRARGYACGQRSVKAACNAGERDASLHWSRPQQRHVVARESVRCLELPTERFHCAF